MAYHSRKETYESNTPSDLSTMNGALYRRSSSESRSIRISNSSVHTTSMAATREDLFDYSEQGPGRVHSISHRKSFHSLEKPTFLLRNESIGDGPVRTSTATSTSKQEIRSSYTDREVAIMLAWNIPFFEDEDGSPLPPAPRSSIYNPSTLPEPNPSSSRIYGFPPSTPDPLTRLYGDSQPFATTEIPTAGNPPARYPSPSPLPPPTDSIGTTSLSHIVPPTKEATSSVSGTVTVQDKGGRRNWNEYSLASSSSAGGSGPQGSTQASTSRLPAAAPSSSSTAPAPAYHQHTHSTVFVSPTETRAQPTAPPAVESSPQSTSTAQTSRISSTAEGYAVTGRVRALHTFEPTEPNELAFEKGDVIMVVNREYKDWWRGQLRGRTGYFPANYVVRLHAHLHPCIC
jgi:hypothetical protein